MTPAVSVLVPVYNAERYLRECLDSLAAQTLRDLEIVCVDDGSTDASPAILREYAEKLPGMKILSGPNGGYGKALNRALEAAAGEWIGIVEPDDFVSPDMFEDLVRIARENRLDFAKADFDRFRDGRRGRVFVREALDRTGRHYGEVFDPSATPRAIRFTMNTWTGVYRRAFLEKWHVRHHETPGASFQDNGFWWQTFVRGRRAMLVPRVYYHNRRDNPASSVYDPGKVFAMNAEYDWIRGLLEDDPGIWDRFKGVYWWKKFANYRFRLAHVADARRLEFTERFRAEFREGLRRREISRAEFTWPEWVLLRLYAGGFCTALERARRAVPGFVRKPLAAAAAPAVRGARRLVRLLFP